MKQVVIFLWILFIIGCSVSKQNQGITNDRFETQYQKFVSNNSQAVVDSIVRVDSLPELVNWQNVFYQLENKQIYYQKFVTVKFHNRFVVISIDSIDSDSFSTVKYRIE